MTKKARQNNGMQDINLADTLIGQSFNDDISNSLSPSQSDIQTDFEIPRSNIDLSLQFQMTSCQGHSFVRNNTVILRYHLYLKEF